jgi:hypothetical protein
MVALTFARPTRVERAVMALCAILRGICLPSGPRTSENRFHVYKVRKLALKGLTFAFSTAGENYSRGSHVVAGFALL